MNNNLTEIVFILDRSGSMGDMAAEAIGGFNSFLEEQKKCDGEAKLTLVLFDHEYQVVYDGLDIQKAEVLNNTIYQPRGTTALLDAVGRAVDDVGKRLASTPEEQRPSKVMVAILTDGLENASKDYTKNKIKEMIAHQEGKYSWKFAFLAANQDAFSEGTGLGISGNMTMNYNLNSAGIKHAFGSISSSTVQYRSTGQTSLSNQDDQSN